LLATPLSPTQPPHYGRGSDRPRLLPRTAVATHHNSQDERPLPAPPLSPTQPPHYGRGSDRPRLSPRTAVASSTTCKMNGRYPHHLSHPRNHLTSAAIYAARGRNLHHNLQDKRPLPSTPLSPPQPPHFGRALTGNDSGRARPLPPTTTCRTNGRYPHHLSHQHNHLTSAAL
jgi:hypothetical protein